MMQHARAECSTAFSTWAGEIAKVSMMQHARAECSLPGVGPQDVTVVSQ